MHGVRAGNTQNSYHQTLHGRLLLGIDLLEYRLVFRQLKDERFCFLLHVHVLRFLSRRHSHAGFGVDIDKTCGPLAHMCSKRPEFLLPREPCPAIGVSFGYPETVADVARS